VRQPLRASCAGGGGGGATNMYSIVELLTAAEVIIKP